jgi:hypothetical protein
MNSPNTTRRSFVATVAASASIVATQGCAGAIGVRSSSAVTPATPKASSKWDDSWTSRLSTYRTVFDVAELDANPGPYEVPAVMDTYHTVLGTSDSDLGFVLVVRHMAVPMLLDSSMWAKYDVAADMKRNDPKTNAAFKTNPFMSVLAAIKDRGVVILGCQSALTGYGYMLAQRAKSDVAETRKEIQAALVPGVIMLPNGLYALARAQNVGCGFMR